MNKCIDIRVKDVTLNVKLFELLKKGYFPELMNKSLPFKVVHPKTL